jgi:hypothetical protein
MMLTTSTITLDVRADLSTAFPGHDDDDNDAPKHPSLFFSTHLFYYFCMIRRP